MKNSNEFNTNKTMAYNDVSSSDIPRLFSMKDIRALVGGKSRSTIYRWVAEGSFPSPVKVCGSTMWPEEVISEWRNKVVAGVQCVGEAI